MNLSSDRVRAWLADRPIAADCLVLVRWNDDLAIQTKWSIFRTYWDSFCYPISDDVDVLPATRDWRLQYHHWEESNSAARRDELLQMMRRHYGGLMFLFWINKTESNEFYFVGEQGLV